MANEEIYWNEENRAPLFWLRSLWHIVRRRRLIVLTVVAVVMLAAALSGMWRPTYEAEMKILVRRQRLDAVVTPQANVTPQINGDPVNEEDLNSEVELLNSEDLLRKVVLETGLAGQRDTRVGTFNDDQRSIALAVRKLNKQLVIEPIRKTDMIAIYYRSPDPQMVTKVLDAIAAAYTAKHLEVERPTGEFAFFNQQRERYQESLMRVQQQLRDFTKDHGVVSAQMERDFALQRMNAFSSAAQDAHTHVAELERRIETLRTKMHSASPRMTTVIKTSENPQLMQQLKATLLTLELKRTELLTKYQANYPLVQEVDQQIAESKAAINAEENKPMHEETTEQDPNFEWLRGELTKTETELAGLKAREADARALAGESLESGRNLDQLGMLQQNLLNEEKADEENYLLYERKSEEARVSDALDQRGILNVAVAEQPVTPYLPVRGPVLVIVFSVFLALVVSVSFAFLVEFLSTRVRPVAETEHYLDGSLATSNR